MNDPIFRCELLSDYYFSIAFTGNRYVIKTKICCELLSDYYFSIAFTGKEGGTNDLKEL
uniref:hypothetical protein n=1 Tax=Winogradskyella pacifica TaxID=664642 RepID=UPI0015F2647C|nr:hypothetical protein [Winogradskyella pacifica]